VVITVDRSKPFRILTMAKNRPQCSVSSDKSGNHLIAVDGELYKIDGLYDVTPINSLRRCDGRLVVDRKRDFGGCGKDAVKLETNVPLAVWLQEMYATAVS
jgi:hypothetical protein